MDAWILMIVLALLCGLIHFAVHKSDQKYRTMETVSTTGMIVRFYQESNRLHYIVRFYAGARQVERQVMGSYSLDTHYDVGDTVNIAYHINEKGHVTAFIQDEMLDEIKNTKSGNLFLILAIIFAVLSVLLFAFGA